MNGIDFDNPEDTPTTEEQKKKAELQKKMDAAEKKLLEKLKEKHTEELQVKVNEAVKEVAERNSELRNKVIELEGQLQKEKQIALNLNAALEDERKIKGKPLSQDEILDALYKTSLNERQKKILTKYGEAFVDFERKLGTPKFNEALNNYMLEKIEQKLMAIKKSPGEK